MGLHRIIHGLAIAGMGYSVVLGFLRAEITALGLLPSLFWLALLIMLIGQPKTWGFGVGLLMLAAVVAQTILWRVALQSSRRAEYGIDESWSAFAISVLPLLLTGLCGVSLRWLWPAEPETPQPPDAPEDNTPSQP